ncbi:MAG: hypothetical protein IH991_24850 [Planctomycetes bacterium]|nr:hypothetical protein [Planctomycetota bacterium]
MATLRTIHTAQMQYQEKAAIDVDDDGIADFGTLKQLQETTPPFLYYTFENRTRLGLAPK